MEPFYFGKDPDVLFGIFHPPSGAAVARAVLLCPPVGHEYVRAHRAFRNLGTQISRGGSAVLRFDYLGSGDSSGDMGQATVAQWIADLDAAADELRRRSGLSRLTLVGLRLGATLAVLAGCQRQDVERLILWDPVLSGRDYLDELDALQQAWLSDRLGAGAEGVDVRGELLGMPITAKVRREIAALDVRGAVPRAAAVDIVTSAARPDCAAWVGDLTHRGVQASCTAVSSAGDWQNPEAVHQLLLPHEILRHVAQLVAVAA